jgi:hypothetical protein
MTASNIVASDNAPQRQMLAALAFHKARRIAEFRAKKLKPNVTEISQAFYDEQIETRKELIINCAEEIERISSQTD